MCERSVTRRMEDKKYYTTKEVAEKLKVTWQTVFRWIKSGKLQYDKIGYQYRITQKHLDEFMKQSKGE